MRDKSKDLKSKEQKQASINEKMKRLRQEQTLLDEKMKELELEQTLLNESELNTPEGYIDWPEQCFKRDPSKKGKEIDINEEAKGWFLFNGSIFTRTMSVNYKDEFNRL